MSDRNKLNLWQKLKRLLTASAPQEVIDALEDERSSSNVTEHVDNAKSSNHKSNSYKANEAKADIDDIEKQTDNFSLTKPDTESTEIVDYLKNYFDNKQWRYTHYRPKVKDKQMSHHLSLHMRSKKFNCTYLFRVQEQNALVAVYGILPFLIPESHKSAAMLLITQINYDMLIGNLEMDVNDGEIRYKSAIDVEVVGIDDAIVEQLLQSVIAMTTVAFEIFNDLINTQDPSDDIPTLLSELRQQADARTFYLPTPKKQ